MFHDEFVVAPKLDRRTKAGKEAYEDFMASVNGRSVVTQDLYDACQARVEVLNAFKPQKNDKTELSIVFDYYGNLCKARFDMLQNDVIIDLKTCRDASPSGFKKAIRNFSYHQQAAFYLDGIKAHKFYFVFIEKKEPYDIVIIDFISLEDGRKAYKAGIKNINTFRELDDTSTINVPCYSMFNKIISM